MWGVGVVNEVVNWFVEVVTAPVGVDRWYGWHCKGT